MKTEMKLKEVNPKASAVVDALGGEGESERVDAEFADLTKSLRMHLLPAETVEAMLAFFAGGYVSGLVRGEKGKGEP